MAKFDPKDYGLDMTVAEYERVLADVFTGAFRSKTKAKPAWIEMTVDTLLVNPSIAIKYCGVVREALVAAKVAQSKTIVQLPEEPICRRLMCIRKDVRKSSAVKTGKRRGL
jgi:hypothetical protein